MNLIITFATLIFFNIAFFLLGGGSTKNTAIWIAYSFIHLAGLCQMVTPLVFNGKHATAASLTMSLKMFSMVHYLVMLLAGIIFILIAPDGWKVTFLVLLFITLIYVTLFVSMLISNRKILRQ